MDECIYKFLPFVIYVYNDAWNIDHIISYIYIYVYMYMYTHEDMNMYV